MFSFIAYLLLGSCTCPFSSILYPCILSSAQVVYMEAVLLTDAGLLLLTLIHNINIMESKLLEPVHCFFVCLFQG